MGKFSEIDYAARIGTTVEVPIDVPPNQLNFRGQAVFANAQRDMANAAKAQGVSLTRFELSQDNARDQCMIIATVAAGMEKRASAKKEK